MTTPEIKEEPKIDQPTPSETPVQKEQAPITEVREEATTLTPSQITQQADDATQQQPVQDDTATPVITITVPATTQQLEDWAKGPAENTLTWIAFYWIRMIKKAILHGWRVIAEPPVETISNA